MAEVQEIKTKQELIDKIKNDLRPFGHNYKIDENTVSVKPYGFDDRIKWNTQIVTLDGYGVIGFISEQF